MERRPRIHNSIGSMSRRTFVRGAVASGATFALLRRGALAATSHLEPPTLSGTSFALTIDELPVDFTGTAAVATAVNGSVPGPILRFREGDTVTLAVTNRLRETSSIHWHGLRVPAAMDGVPGLSFPGIAPDETFVYRFPVIQRGTYWYHSHSRFQEQTGLYGPLIIDPMGEDAVAYDREHVVLLSDWTDEDPGTVVGNLKQQSDYYNFHQRTAGDFVRDVQMRGLAGTLAERWMWNKMNMSPTDILDVSGATYTYLLNGSAPDANWIGLFRPGERVRLRFINGSAMSIFDVRIPDLAMTVVQSDGNDVESVVVDEFRISVAETYDVIVEPRDDRPYTIFAQAEDRTGFARGTLAPRHGMAGLIPPMDPRPVRTMVDMGMAMGAMHGAPVADSRSGDAATAHDMHAMSGTPRLGLPRTGPTELALGPTVASVAEHPTERLDSAGEGLVARRVLAYADLRALHRGTDPRPPSREIEIHLTGNMERFIWSFDGEKFSDAEPIRLRLGERVRIILVNDSMMEHPIHLHGLWSELENGEDDHRPYKHTINVKPGERLSYLVTADTPGHWAYHCHLLYHMEAGMFRTVIVS